MPFTITHVAAILPITKLVPKLPFSALAIGSMLPDAPIFLTLGFGYSFLHSFQGLILAIVPLGLIAYTIFQRYLKEPLASLAPDFVQCRLNHWLDTEKRHHPLSVSIALILGGSTHLIWDLFTHNGRWGVEQFAFLQRTYSMAGTPVAGHEIAQHGSSIVFLPILFLLLIRKMASQPKNELESKTPKQKGLAQSLLLLAPIVSSLLVWNVRKQNLMSFLFETTVLTGIIAILVIASYSLVFNSKKERIRARATSGQNTVQSSCRTIGGRCTVAAALQKKMSRE